MGNHAFRRRIVSCGLTSFGLIAALTGPAWGQDQGLPLPPGPPGIQGRSANRIQGTTDNEAASLGKELQRLLKDEVFTLGEATVLPADREGRARFNKRGMRMLSVELPYTTDAMSEETRARLVAQGRGDLSFQHVTFNGEDPARSALQYATEDLASERAAVHRKSSTGIIVRGNRIAVLEDQSRLLAHSDPRAREIARERLEKFAQVGFQFSGGSNEDLQAQLLILGPDELVVTLPREFDDDLLDRGFSADLARKLAGAKLVRGKHGVSYVVAASEARRDQIADELLDASTAAAQQARMATQAPAQTQQGGPATSDGFTSQLEAR